MGPASLCIDQLVMYIHFDEKLLEDVMNFMMKVLVSMISTQVRSWIYLILIICLVSSLPGGSYEGLCQEGDREMPLT
jgi:hypothetical protein